MSEIRVNSIRGVSGSAAAITVGTDSCSVKLNNRQGRNMVVNGGCLIAQRGTSSTSAGMQTVDRFMTTTSGVDEEPTQEQVDVASGTPAYISGLRKAFKVTNGNQTSGAGATDQLSIEYRLEAQDIRNSGWNYISATSFITLSFWIKSSIAQNFTGRLLTIDGTAQNYPFETGSLTANTWTKISKTIPGNANLSFDDNTNNGLSIFINGFLGTDLTGSVTLNAWAAPVATTLTPDVPSTWYTTDNATLEITGLQLELGEVASAFHQRSLAEESSLCERYFQRLPKDPTDGYGPICGGRSHSSTQAEMMVTIPEMRSAPTIGSSGNLRILHGGTGKAVSGITLLHAARSTVFFRATVASGLSSGDSAQLTMDNDATAHITLTAEL